MPLPPTGSMRMAAAELLLPMMNSFGLPCTGAAHDWSIVQNLTVPWTDRYACGDTTYPVAITCAHCDQIAGFGG